MKRIFSREGELSVTALIPLLVLVIYLQKGWFEQMHENFFALLRMILFVYCCSMFYKYLLKSLKTIIGKDGSRHIVVTLYDFLVLGILLVFCLLWFCFQDTTLASWLVAATLGPYLAYSTLRCWYILGSVR